MNGILMPTKYEMSRRAANTRDVTLQIGPVMLDNDTPNDNLIPYGDCQCGCGEKTSVAAVNDLSRGLKQGDPRKYLKGHHFRKKTKVDWDESQQCFSVALTKGQVALVDAEDIDLIQQRAWHVTTPSRGRPTYAQTGGSRSPRSRAYMHRLIAGLNSGDRLQVDHKNGNGLDNRRSNLRICDQSHNNAAWLNLSRNNTSSFRGVSWHALTKKWRAHVQVDGRQIHLGVFEHEEDAAKAYDAAAIEAFGEFARPNFTRITIEELA